MIRTSFVFIFRINSGVIGFIASRGKGGIFPNPLLANYVVDGILIAFTDTNLSLDVVK